MINFIISIRYLTLLAYMRNKLPMVDSHNKVTTPTLDIMQKNMLIFNHAISPAPVTILSVPISLSNITLYQLKDKAHYAYNIVSLAKDAGFKATWISNQGRSGKSNSLITVIANMADNKIHLFSDDYNAEKPHDLKIFESTLLYEKKKYGCSTKKISGRYMLFI
ncbi:MULTISPECIES: sulfatase-like hydrolase/transferase [Photorhabdus]|uniref:Sulfatase N-terminal domain-containing protein n=1 Tax=Photorhabdus thracensis TaxID=230089 RepID=A0A0F7LJP9_9GAMM|nr:sulfatase-like hydrolase/transferase [Photorhabdus thracensis]AKH63329.1 hypothetical protein VY86_08220 [Photorhabdus thracensis]MCC8422466.1 hypothetical protein [Photorhabdus thracensis]